MDHELASIDLDLAPNEASGLLPVADRPLLDAHGWDHAFWVVLDEGPVEVSVAVVGHAAGAEVAAGWTIERLHAIVEGDQVKTEDAEAVARHDGWIYVFGSQFGKKDGPLQPKRSFVARFRETEVRHVLEPPAAALAVARPPFLLHRLVNDALRDGGPEPVRLGPRSHQALIAATRARGRTQVRDDDLPSTSRGRRSATTAPCCSACASRPPPTAGRCWSSWTASSGCSSPAAASPRCAGSGSWTRSAATGPWPGSAT
jgi:hypothetical protein